MNSNDYAAVIFDMDDTLAMTAPLWRAAETRLLADLGHPWRPELAARYKGMRAGDVATVIHQALQPTLPAPECGRRLRDYLIENFRRMTIEPARGGRGCLERFGNHVPLALASGSPMEAIELVLDRLDYRSLFDVVLTSENVDRGKPAPDIFLAAADALSVPPSQCLVIEDSVAGARAAQAAGMRCFVVPSVDPADLNGLATAVFESLEAITPEACTAAEAS